jgi:hypothetical protein
MGTSFSTIFCEYVDCNTNYWKIELWALLLTIIVYVIFAIKYTNLSSRECANMNNVYSSLNGNIKSINSNDVDCSGNLCQYYIMTAYNACSGGQYENDVVDICNLKAVLKNGVRCLDFEIYSIDNQPVVATSTLKSYYNKETFNYIDFSQVMNIIQSYAFASGTAPNYTDPIFLHLRIKSDNQLMYTNFASIFKSYDSLIIFCLDNHRTDVPSRYKVEELCCFKSDFGKRI